MKQVTILGLGPGSTELLTISALQALQKADLVVGAQRLLQALPNGCTGQLFAATRSEDILRLLQTNASWNKAAIVMSGDVGMFSGAKGLLGKLEGYEVRVFPGISSAVYFAAKLQKPWQGWRFISAHGVACNPAVEVMQCAETFFVTGGENTVGEICTKLCAAGLGSFAVTVGEKLSYPEEKITRGTAEELAGCQFASLSVMLVEKPVATPQLWPWANTGIPDELFLRGKVPMTKQEVRAAALAKLKVVATDILWDVGSGTGSVAVEMALQARLGHVYAIERGNEGISLLHQNAARFGVCNLTAIEGYAPEALEGLPAPNAVFIGGSGGKLAAILAKAYIVNPRARICVACITLETLQEATELLAARQYTGFEVCQISVTRSEQAGRYNMLKAHNPVFLVSAEGGGQ